MTPCPAGLVVLGALWTQDPARPTAEAMAIDAGRIVAVGSADEVRACAGPGARVVDLGGAVVLPGFVDAHAHPFDAGLAAGHADLSAARTEAEVLATVDAWARAHPRARWVQGGGWDASRLEAWRPRAALDALSPDRPVFLASADGHSAWVNSAALRVAGLLHAPDPRGGRVERDAAGVPTGTVRETAVDRVASRLPTPSRAEADSAVDHALAQLRAVGVTTVVDAAADPVGLRAWARAARDGRLTARVRAAIPVETAGEVRRVARLARRHRDDALAVTQVKVYLDGVVESRTAWMLAPYTDGSNGPALFDDATLDRVLDRADRQGLQVHAHAIGDAAVRQLLDAVDRHGPLARPVLAAHVEGVDPADRPRFAALGVVPVVSALWAFPDPYVTELTLPVLGPERTATIYPFAGLGPGLVLGSDWDVTTVNPWPAIEVGATRRDPEVPGAALGPEQALPPEALVRAGTAAAAAAVLGPDRAGRLAPGLAADFVVLDRDPRTLPADALGDVHPCATWVGGREVWTAPPTGSDPARSCPR